ncbi:uncharacterized protein LOC117172641 [Belonocnema kinseyi]|uniref:uncharacterized protein LOC117172641 n=1 Tax=Belonocnema kinseyi TaxID=2817044 RepID=UPI00143DCA1F|nr:uncharacterized protein LOC117172641 [Belonocnema kinseyi]
MTVVLRDLQTVLRHELGDEVIVDNYSVNSLVPPGENYSSTILSVMCSIKQNKNGATETLHLVAKMTPTSNLHRQFFDNCFIFKKEIFFYKEIIPLYKNLEMEFGVEENSIFDIGPKFYGSRLSSNPKVDFDDDALILLENLKVRGYYTGERKLGLDLDHSRAAIRALAKFHALGVALKCKRPEQFEILKHESKHHIIKPGAFQGMKNSLENALLTDPLISQYSSKWEPIMKTKPDFSSIPPEPWTTIVHSDFWLNNVMFHKDQNGKIDEIKFIDFQNYIFQSPINDLIFFICSSVVTDLISKNLESLLDLYYETFVAVLKIMNCDVSHFGRDKFDEKVKNDAKKELKHCVLFINIQTIDVEKDGVDATDLQSVLEHHIPNENFFDKMRQIIMLFVERGWI